MTEMDNVQAELEAMKVIVDALRPLTSESVKKVLRFVNDTYPSKGTAQVTPDDGQGNQPTSLEFHELFELFDTALPKTGPERALVAGYWLQVIQGNEEWDSLTMNRELKSLEKESKNITRDLDVLVRRIPRWVHQSRKEEGSRKTYKLTNEGTKAVQRMIAKNQASLSVESE